MTYADLGFLNAVQSVRPPDYMGEFARAFALSSEMPWSARETRKRQMEDTQLAMQQAKFQADMARQAREMQIQEMMLPYQLQRAQRLAAGNPQAGVGPTGGSAMEILMNLPRPGQATPQTPAQPLPMTEEIPVLPYDDLPQDPVMGNTPDLGLIPDIPAF